MRPSTKVMKTVSGFLGILFLLWPLTVFAQTRVVVIPLGDDAKPLKNIITVAKAKGNFTDPVAAVNSISDASADNPYLVVIGPGVYTITQTLVMKEYVDITGSGEMVTKLKGAISTENDDASSAILSGANNSSLSSLTVENTGGSEHSIALHNNNASPVVSYVTARASGGTKNWGIYNHMDSSPTMANVSAMASGGINRGVYNGFSSHCTMRSVSATASGGTESYGVYNNVSSPVMTDVSATASGATSSNHGVFNTTSSATMTNVTATAFGGSMNCGVFNLVSSPTMTNVTATASGGTYSYGAYIDSSSCIIGKSTMDGGTHALHTAEDSSATISQSTLIGGVGGTGTNQCVACDDDDGIELGADCL